MSINNNNSSNVNINTNSTNHSIDRIENTNTNVNTSTSTSIDASTQLLNMIQDETVRQLELAWEAQQQLALLCHEKEYETKMKNQ